MILLLKLSDAGVNIFRREFRGQTVFLINAVAAAPAPVPYRMVPTRKAVASATADLNRRQATNLYLAT